MSGYVHSSGVPYEAYLRERSPAGDRTAVEAGTSRRIIASIRDSSAQLIASQEALRSQNIEILKATKAGFKQLAWDVQQTTAAVRVLDATFSWGFNSVLAHTGRMADTLESLLVTAKTPSKTRAYEHFDDARKAFDLGHVSDALEQVDRAIFGDHTSPGYKLEWRFHLLRGAILVGTYSHPQLLDLPAAEESYRSAARYARPEDAKGASLALLGAGWACYCQGRLDDALSQTNAATTLSPTLAEGHFQASKILMSLGRSGEGLHRLEIAIGLDPGYVVKAAADGDFQNFTTEFDAWCATEGEKSRSALQTLYDKWSWTVVFWKACAAAGVNLPVLASIVHAAQVPLLDTLVCLHALDPVTRDLKVKANWTALEARKAIETIPETLDIPTGLLQSLPERADAWALDADYFALAGVLLKRGHTPTVEALCNRAHTREAKPLELYALWLSVSTKRATIVDNLTRHLERVPASGRKVLIDDFQGFTDSYARETVHTIRTSLLKRYEQWTDEIAEDLRYRANEGTMAPLQGIASNVMWSTIAVTIAALVLQQVFHSTNLSAVAWLAGMTLAVGQPVTRRILSRRRRLRSLLNAESRVLRSLTTKT